MVKLEIKTLSNEVFYVECEENESVCDHNFDFDFQIDFLTLISIF